MSRTLKPAAVALVGSCLVLSLSIPAASQEAPPAAGPLMRPPAPQLQVEAVSPELQQLLEEWEQSSKQIQKLQGQHKRMVQDLTFNVEKQSTGEFYYEAPDRGRIDIVPIKVTEGALSQNKNPTTKQQFGLQADHPEQWVCDGKQIMQIDHGKKECTIVTIPEQSRGHAIMDGPLPFLFGMPAEQAKRRYKIELKRSPSPTQHYLTVEPRLQHDAANWKMAHIFLDKKELLPTAVKLIDPAGSLETIYQFSNVEKNKPRGVFAWWSGDPFAPSLRGLTITQTKTENHLLEPVGANQPESAPKRQVTPLTPTTPAAPTTPATPAGTVPNVVGMRYDAAEATILKAGYVKKWAKGPVAPAAPLQGLIKTQSPAPGTPLKPGSEVTLMFYGKIPEKAAAAPSR